MIAAGKMRDRVTVTATLVTQRPNGESVESPDTGDSFTVWGEVRQQSNAEQVRNGINTADTTYAIRIRYRDGLTSNDVKTTSIVEVRGRKLDIVSVTEVGYREALDIVAKERAA